MATFSRKGWSSDGVGGSFSSDEYTRYMDDIDDARMLRHDRGSRPGKTIHPHPTFTEVIEVDERAKFAGLMEEAKKGNVKAQFLLGKEYISRGDLREAEYWLRKVAALSGWPEAEAELSRVRQLKGQLKLTSTSSGVPKGEDTHDALSDKGKKGSAFTRKVQGQKLSSGTKPRNTPFSSLDELLYSPVHQQDKNGKRPKNKLDQWAAAAIGRPLRTKPHESKTIVSVRRAVYKYHYNVISLAYPIKTLRELKFCNYIVIRRSLIVVNGTLLDVFQELFAFCVKRRKYHILALERAGYFKWICKEDTNKSIVEAFSCNELSIRFRDNEDVCLKIRWMLSTLGFELNEIAVLEKVQKKRKNNIAYDESRTIRKALGFDLHRASKKQATPGAPSCMRNRVKCPRCGCMIKAKELERHIRMKHGPVIPAGRIIDNSLSERQQDLYGD